MKIVINSTEYTAFDGLSFSPEADLTNNSLPINEFEARIFTNAYISYGQWAQLKDDNNNLWANYWLRYAERIGKDDDHQTYIVKVIGQSPIAFLERVKLSAEYLNDTAYNLIDDVLEYVGDAGQIGDIIRDNVVATAFQGITITGFAPEQTARERLQWLLLAAGGYVQSYGDTVIHIEKVATSGGAIIPIDKTFWKPSITFRDYVTKIKVHGYSFTSGTPSSGDTYVTDGTNYWIQTEQVITLTNNNAPNGAPKNEIEIEGVTIISPTLASTVATNLAAYYFNRCEIDADVINNWSYKPGERVTINTDEDTLYSGYIDRAAFKFGLQARSSIHLTGALGIDGATLTVLYKWGTIQVAKRVYYFPKGYSYSITTEYLDQRISGHRYIFRPTSASVTGTLSADDTKTVNVAIALDYYRESTGEQAALENEYSQTIAALTAIYQAKLAGLQASYKGGKKQKEKYINGLRSWYDVSCFQVRDAFVQLINATPADMAVLEIISVDDVSQQVDVVDDPTDRTVVIDE